MGACAASIALSAGCGQAPQEKVRQAAEDYIDAISARDFGAACDQFTARYRAELGGTSGCVRAQTDQYGAGGSTPDLEITGVRVNGDRANVSLNLTREGESPSPLMLLMVKQGEAGWKIRGQQ